MSPSSSNVPQTQPSKDAWGLTLGDRQYAWLKQTLATSTAKYKFVFIHNLVGGLDGQMRGVYAHGDEWRKASGPVARPKSGQYLKLFELQVYHGGALVLDSTVRISPLALVVPNAITPGIGISLWHYDVIGADGNPEGSPELTRAGIEVPPGFVVRTESFEHFIHALEREAPFRARVEGLDANGIDCGGWLIAVFQLRVASGIYWSSVTEGLYPEDPWMGLIKPFALGFVIVTIGCHVGLRTSGGTQGVGRTTTNAVVAASVAVIAVDFFLTPLLITLMY